MVFWFSILPIAYPLSLSGCACFSEHSKIWSSKFYWYELVKWHVIIINYVHNKIILPLFIIGNYLSPHLVHVCCHRLARVVRYTWVWNHCFISKAIMNSFLFSIRKHCAFQLLGTTWEISKWTIKMLISPFYHINIFLLKIIYLRARSHTREIFFIYLSFLKNNIYYKFVFSSLSFIE